MRPIASFAFWGAMATACAFGGPAYSETPQHSDAAADEPENEPSAARDDSHESKDAEDASPGEGEDQAKPEKPKASSGEATVTSSAAEEPGKTYRFVGLRYRGIVVPQFMESAFASGGRTLYVNAVGPEFVIRKDDREFGLSPWLAFYSMGDTAFKGKSDPETAWELINANLAILYLTSDILWSHSFTPEWAVNYGLGVGFGIVFGSLHRVQSYPTAPNQSPDHYAKCAGPGMASTAPGTPPVTPDVIASYCDATNDHYGGYSEKSWANGGSKPMLFPWLVAQTGIRFKASKSFVARLDLGFGTSGFFFGLGGDYGL